LYNAIVKSVLLYNCETWGLSKTDQNSLDAFHRHQLRRVLNIVYPQIISNVALYNKCESEPISLEILTRRWRLFGHILRLDLLTPAQKAMDFFFEPCFSKKFIGRPRTTIFVTLNEDLKRLKSLSPDFREISCLQSSEDLMRFRSLAADRQHWRKLVHHCYIAAKTERSL
jgi:hypothetical protein